MITALEVSIDKSIITSHDAITDHYDDPSDECNSEIVWKPFPESAQDSGPRFLEHGWMMGFCRIN
jgi:hypothetical protein